MPVRDMSKREWHAAMERHGMRESGFMGYVNINVPGHHIEVSKLNAGGNRRRQLAYLLNQRNHAMAECACGHMNAEHAYLKRKYGKITGYLGCKCGCEQFKDGRHSTN